MNQAIRTAARAAWHAAIAVMPFVMAVARPAGAIAEDYEQPITFHAEKILEPKLLAGPVHHVDDLVTNDGYMNHFVVHSDFGDFAAVGRPALEKTVAEVSLIRLIREQYPTSEVVHDATKKTAVGIVRAPIDGAVKAYDTLTDREKLMSTASSITGGVVHLFDVAADAITDGVQATYNASRRAVGAGKDDGSESGSGISLSKTASFVSDQALDYIGYTKAYLRVAKAVKADPYTDNDELRWEMKRVATLQTSVRLTAKLAPGLPGIPYVGSFNKYTKYAETVAEYQDPRKVAELNEQILDALAKVNRFGGDAVSNKVFLDNENYSPVMKNAILNALEQLKDVEGFGALVQAAARAGSREIAWFYVRAIQELATEQQNGTTFRTVIRDTVIPAAVDAKGRLVIPLPVDYLLWTEDVAELFHGEKAKVHAEYGVKSVELRLSGDLSPRCRRELRALGATTIKTHAT